MYKLGTESTHSTVGDFIYKLITHTSTEQRAYGPAGTTEQLSHQSTIIKAYLCYMCLMRFEYITSNTLTHDANETTRGMIYWWMKEIQDSSWDWNSNLHALCSMELKVRGKWPDHRGSSVLPLCYNLVWSQDKIVLLNPSCMTALVHDISACSMPVALFFFFHIWHFKGI